MKDHPCNDAQQPHEPPEWMVAFVQYGVARNQLHVECAGTLVDPSWVLTAAASCHIVCGGSDTWFAVRITVR